MEHEEDMNNSKGHKGMNGFMDLGRKDMMCGMIPPGPAKKQEPRIYYPSLHIEKEKLPSKARVGDMVMAEVKLRLKGIEERQTDNDKKIVRCEYEVMAIKFGGSHYQKE